MHETIQHKTTRAVKHTLIFKTLGQICGVGATIFLVRTLSENEYGIYNLLYSIIGLLGTIASLGIGNTLQRYLPEYYKTEEFCIANKMFRTASMLRFLADTAILGVIIIFWQGLAPLLKLSDYKNYFYIFTFVIILYQHRTILDICLSSYFLHKYSKSIAVLFSITKAAGYAAIMILDLQLYHVIFIDLAANFTACALLHIAYAAKIPKTGGIVKDFSKKEKKRVARYALFYNFNDSGVGLLNAGFDNFIIVMFMSPLAVGAYSFCVMLSIQITSLLPLKYFKDVVKPLFFSMSTAATDRDAVNRLFQGLVKINFIFALPCFFFLLLYADTLIQLLFKGKFIEYTPVLMGILLFSFINSIPLGTVAQLKERADIILYSKVFALYNLIADIFLIQWFGIWGAVLATGTATTGKNLFIWYFIRKDAGFKGMASFFGGMILFWVSISSAAYLINTQTVIPDVYQLFLGMVFFSIAFLFQFKCNLFTDYEHKLIVETINNKPKIKKIIKLFSWM